MSGEGRNTMSSYAMRPALLLLAALTLATLAIVPTTAAAATPQPFWTRCAADTEADLQCRVPRGIATAPATAPTRGNLYVADSVNQRVVEFTAWGEFVKAWGWDVVQSGSGDTGTGFEICVRADGDVCKAGASGSGAGQFGPSSPQGIAIDSAGNVYLLDRGLPSNQRVQKFDPEGNFLRMWGKEVNTGTGANKEICTNAGSPTDVCGKGGEGTGPGQFGSLSVVGDYIDVDTKGTASELDDDVYVGEVGRIQRFDTSGVYEAEIAVAGEVVKGLAVAPDGSLYASFCGTSCAHGVAAKAGVRKLSPAGATLDTVAVADPQGLATDSAGDLYAIDGGSNPTIRKFSGADGEEFLEEESIFPFFPTYPFTPGLSTSTGIAIGDGCLTAPDYNLYLSNSDFDNAFIRSYGPPPDETHVEEFESCEPPAVPPAIEDQGTLSVETGSASVQAVINPRFWQDTTYQVQFAEATCVEAGGWEAPCVKAKPASPALLGAGVTDVGAKTSKVALTGLASATEYRYRFTAESGGGGPVLGEEVAFTTTSPPPPPETGCPNQALRTGAGAFLPDCRAYEMVSPVDKNGGEARPGRNEAYIQVSPDGEGITYTALSAFAEQPSNKVSNQYLSGRGAGGWSTRGINLPLGRPLAGVGFPSRETAAFSADLCDGWFIDKNHTPLTPDAPQGFVNLYRQELCGEGGLEALIKDPPIFGSPVSYATVDSVQGFSADLGHVLIVAEGALNEEALAITNTQIYDYSPASGELALVSVLPGGGSPDPGLANRGAQVGGGVSGKLGGTLEGAVSEDGERVFWTSAAEDGRGTLYLRTHPEQGIVAEECEGDNACTIEVSVGDKAIFWGAKPDGSEAIFSEGEFVSSGAGQATLYRFDTETETRTPRTEGIRGVLGASENLSRVYYVSTENLAPGIQNSEGDEAQAGEPNLYLDDEGEITFIATLLDGKEGDVSANQNHVYSLGAPNPLWNASRVTPDGTHIAFQSRAPLTGFDNTDAITGEADVEVFTYEAGGELHCVSCDPSGVRPTGKNLTESFDRVKPTSPVRAAAWIPAHEHPLNASNVLSENGGRLFFMSHIPLVTRDTNGAQDVYEWEAAGEGGCEEESPHFRELNGGCVYLISSGESPVNSELWDASPDGRDVFFTTEASLLAQDPGNIDLYDARAGGGFPQPIVKAPCEGEACANPPVPPNDPTPASVGFRGAGNVVGPGSRPRCGKGKVRRKGRCVARKRKSTKQRKRNRTDNDNRRAKR